ncbi:multidrug effflux MFS transporter [Flavimaricola marinus]|uniref:Bcr/CflA family efflux transporter n=1 Tax=Flavimaricola marinus TaxID=1819565 RepID=A0A238LHN1_9RHOB|nr:multidrug effflux MFS transporter [Flavimaricola marinus]SMY09092.1 Bicyclomycin resistance protein [Flavimaricola marinus]
MQNSFVRTAVVLGLLSAVGPFAIDMYLPALPAIAEGLETTVAATQLTLTMYFVAFGLAQMFYGPLADQVGRKRPLIVGLSIFTVASVGCAVATTVEALTAFRFLQGLGGAAVMVIPRAIIRDMYTGPNATKLMALIMLVSSVSPMLAPLAGSGLIALGHWRGIFWVLAVAAVASMALTTIAQPETLAVERRTPVRVAAMRKGMSTLFRDPIFMGLTFVGSFGISSFFVFIASASFVYAESFGLSPTQFSIAFAVNAVGFIGASQMAGPLGQRYGMLPVMRRAVIGFAVLSAALFVLTLAGFGSLYVIVGMLLLANACLGLVIPTAMVIALDGHGEHAGLASSLGGTIQLVVGGAMIALTGPFFDGTALPMVACIALCGVLSLAMALWVFPKMAELDQPTGNPA